MKQSVGVFVLLMLFSTMAGNAFADTNWTNLDGNSAWNCAGNWNNGEPNSLLKTNIWDGSVDGPIITTGVFAETLQLDLGHTLDINGGYLIANSWLIIGYGGTSVGTMNISGTGHVSQTADYMTLGYKDESTGNLKMTGGELSLYSNMYLGRNTATSTGNLTMGGGKITCANMYVGNNGTGNVTVDSGDIFLSGGHKDLYVGQNSGSVGHMTINGGLVKPSDDVFVGSLAGSEGSLTITGGQLQAVDDVKIGDSGTGHLTITNNGKLTGDVLDFGNTATAVASITMSGGEILAREFVMGRNGKADMVMTDGYIGLSSVMYVGQTGDGSLDMTGGEIKIGTYGIDPNTGNVIGGGPFVVGRNDGSTGEVHLGGGKITAHHMEMQWAGATTANPSLDMTDGTLILTDPANFYKYILDGYITALGGDGTFRYDTTTIPGQTIITAGLEGDANGDGVVDAADYIILKKNFGAGVGGGAAAGNFDETGTVDWADLSSLMTNMGTGGASPAVPEPATMGLLAIGALAIIRRRRAWRNRKTLLLIESRAPQGPGRGQSNKGEMPTQCVRVQSQPAPRDASSHHDRHDGFAVRHSPFFALPRPSCHRFGHRGVCRIYKSFCFRFLQFARFLLPT